MLNDLFNQFMQEKRYLDGVSKKTLVWYEYSFRQYKMLTDQIPTKTLLTQFVIQMQKSKLSKRTINNYIKGFSVFLGWLAENGHTPERLHIKLVKQEEKVLATFTDKHLEAIICYKPKSKPQERLHTLLLFLIDTGCRIDEALTLTRQNVDLESLAVKVRGKGAKERIVPISIELSKSLYKFFRGHEFELVFCTHDGRALSYRNMLRDFKLLGRKLGFNGVRVSFHTLRHTFAVNYVRHGGNLFYLQRQLGHTDLSMTRRYVNLQTDDLREMHSRLSPLSRLK
jgi:integrase/recombinase XerD